MHETQSRLMIQRLLTSLEESLNLMKIMGDDDTVALEDLINKYSIKYKEITTFYGRHSENRL